jgi:iron(III) transport system permease protein
MYGVLGIVTVLGVHAVPLVYVTVAAGLASRAEPDVERAARASGAGALTAFRTVTLPLLRPSLLAGGTLAFVTAVNAFGVPAVLGTPTGFTTVTTLIYADLIRSADPAAFTRVLVLSAGLVALTLAVVAQGDLRAGLAGAVRRTGASAGGATALPRARVGAAAVWVYAVSSAIVPLVGLALMAFTRAVGLPPVPSNLTLDNFKEAVGGIGAPALGRSLVLSVAAATIALGLGALITALRRQRLGGGLGTIVTLTFALPGSALAVAVLLSYGSWLRDTMLLILIAYLAKFWALAQRPLAGAADAIPDDLQRAARASGADAATAVRTVTVPLLRPALAAAWLLVFLFALHEVTISSLLYGPGSQTLAVVVLNLRQLGDVTVTAALSLVLTMLVLAGAGGLALVRRLPSAGGTR